MTQEASKVAAGQVWWNNGFCCVKSVSPEGIVTVAGPCDFWNDAQTTRHMRWIAADLMTGESGWEGPYVGPEYCKHAEFSTTLGKWVKMGLIL